MASLEKTFYTAAHKFKIRCLNLHQKTEIRTVIIEKKDVFVNLPTGFGKSLMYQALPFVVDEVSRWPGHIVAVVSPLLSLCMIK
jgi:superfamily II DNA helicase RecQ